MRTTKQSLNHATRQIALLAALCASPAAAQTNPTRGSTQPPLTIHQRAPDETPGYGEQLSPMQPFSWTGFPSLLGNGKSHTPLEDIAIPGFTNQLPTVPWPTAGLASKPPISSPSNSFSEVTPQPITGAGAAQPATTPSFFFPPPEVTQTDCYGRPAAYNVDDFLATPINPIPTDPHSESLIYRGKFPVPVQRPWVEWWRPLYTGGIYPPAKTWLGETNLLMPHFMVYGDFRTGAGVHQVENGPSRSLATRLNLDLDLQLTATERFHAFVGPLDRAGDLSRIDFSDSQNIEFVDRTDLRLDTAYFEGDVGAILGGLQGVDSPFDLPFTVGLVPLLYQNGIWMEDALIGGAFAIPAKNSSRLGWSNFDATFFAASDQVTSDAFKADNNAAQIFGSAWFIEAYEGYIEADYAFVHDRVGGDRSYNNASIAFTRRYLTYLSNSVRFISNSGQSLPSDQRTADGFLILLENSLISSRPNTFVPYANFFYGSGKPQSAARALGSGGILRNTGINFEFDGLTNYPTLNATANNSYGAAFGLNMLGNNFSQQLVLELAALGVTGSPQFRNVAGDQYAAGVRYQRPLSYRWIFRADSMYGWRRDDQDVAGSRIEFRWKF